MENNQVLYQKSGTSHCRTSESQQPHKDQHEATAKIQK